MRMLCIVGVLILIGAILLFPSSANAEVKAASDAESASADSAPAAAPAKASPPAKARGAKQGAKKGATKARHGAPAGKPASKPTAEEMFKRADTDNDGKLSLDEFRVLHGHWANRPGPRGPQQGNAAQKGSGLRRILSTADADKDGAVTQEEFKKVFPKAPAERFEQLDRNKDGRLDASDAPPAPPAAKRGQQPAARQGARPPQRTPGLLAGADADQDGKVSYEELSAAKPGFPREAFDRLDANKDGALDQQELQAQRQRAGARGGRASRKN